VNGRIIIPTFPSPSSPNEIQPKAPSINDVLAQFRELYLMNINTFFLNKEDLSNSKKKRTKKKMMRRKKMKNGKTFGVVRR